MGARRRTTLRVNTLRSGAAAILGFFRERAVKHERVRWYPDAFVLRDLRERDVESWDAYREGHVYLQSLSSMVPALALGPAAGRAHPRHRRRAGEQDHPDGSPHGKPRRHPRQRRRSDPGPAPRVQPPAAGLRASSRSGSAAGKSWERSCPKVSTGSWWTCRARAKGGSWSSSPATSRSWSTKTVAECVRLQRRLLASGTGALKPGGVLVYSTCTLNLDENERIVQWALDTLPLEVEKLPLAIPGTYAGMARGLDPRISRALRIFPDAQKEGFFVCRLRKTR